VGVVRALDLAVVMIQDQLPLGRYDNLFQTQPELLALFKLPNNPIGNSLAGTLPPWLAVVDTTARLVVVVPSWELPHFAGVDFDTLDFAVCFAHTYIRCSKCSACQCEGYSIVAPLEGVVVVVALHAVVLNLVSPL